MINGFNRFFTKRAKYGLAFTKVNQSVVHIEVPVDKSKVKAPELFTCYQFFTGMKTLQNFVRANFIYQCVGPLLGNFLCYCGPPHKFGIQKFGGLDGLLQKGEKIGTAVIF